MATTATQILDVVWDAIQPEDTQMAKANLFLHLLLLLRLAAVTAAPSCDRQRLRTVAPVDLLRGEHLTVFDTPWPSFAYLDETTPSGWGGLDVDLLNAFSERLGFNYTIHELHQLPNETTWTPTLIRAVGRDAPLPADLIMSFWSRSESRVASLSFLSGHVDSSAVLTARMATNPTPSIVEKLTSFLRPFEWPLWLCLIAMIVASGAVDYLLERKSSPGARLGGCIYEYVAGTLWGGFESPRSRSSALYQVVVSFLILVTVSACASTGPEPKPISSSEPVRSTQVTVPLRDVGWGPVLADTANLAAFITISAQSSVSAESIEDVMAQELTACAYDDSNFPLQQVSRIYPRLHYMKYSNAQQALFHLAATEKCDAVIMSKIQFDSFKVEEKACRMKLVQTIFPELSGWVTAASNPCLVRAFEWALVGIQRSGELDRLLEHYLPAATCTEDLTQEFTSDGRYEDGQQLYDRRRLYDFGRDEAVDAPDYSAHQARPKSRRALKGTSAKTAAGDDEEVGTMDLTDFIGLFTFWGITTIVVYIGAHIEWVFGERVRKLHARAASQAAAAARNAGVGMPEELLRMGMNGVDSLTTKRSKGARSATEQGFASEDQKAAVEMGLATASTEMGAANSSAKNALACRSSKAQAISSLEALKLDVNDDSAMLREMMVTVLELKEGLEEVKERQQAGMQGGRSAGERVEADTCRSPAGSGLRARSQQPQGSRLPRPATPTRLSEPAQPATPHGLRPQVFL